MLVYLLITLQVLDLLTTVVALRKPGLKEGNPYLRWLMDRIGVVPALLVVKGCLIVFLFWAVPLMHIGVVVALCVLYVVVVANNLRLLLSR